MKTLLTCFSTVLLLSSTALAQTMPRVEPVPQTPSSPSQPVGSSGEKPAGPAGPAAPARPPAYVPGDYKLVPGDKLRVEVYKDAQVSQNVQVRPDGKITLPLANDIAAAGKTPGELRTAIADALKNYIANPTVTVIVVETVPPVIYVMGEVNASGPQSLIGRMDVLQALAAAGGFKDFANTKNIKIRRGSEIIKFNYNEAIKGNGTPVFLQPGDTVIVP